MPKNQIPQGIVVENISRPGEAPGVGDTIRLSTTVPVHGNNDWLMLEYPANGSNFYEQKPAERDGSALFVLDGPVSVGSRLVCYLLDGDSFRRTPVHAMGGFEVA